MNLNEKIKQYQELKQSKKEIEKLFEAKIKPYKDAMRKLELEMLDFLNETKQDRASTESGMVYKSILTSLVITDGTLLYEFIKKNDAIDILQRKINKSTYEQYIDDDIEVPGVGVTSRITLNIRKK